MSRKVRVKAGKKGIALPDGRVYDGQVDVVLTDEQFARIRSAAFLNTLDDLGSVADPDIDAQFVTDAVFNAHANDLLLHTSGIEVGYVENVTTTKTAIGTVWTSADQVAGLMLDVPVGPRPVWAEAEMHCDVTLTPAAGVSAAVQAVLCTDLADPLGTTFGYGAVQIESGAGSAGVAPFTLRVKGRLGIVTVAKTIFVVVAKANVTGFSAEVLNGNGSIGWKSTLTAYTR